MINQQVEIDFRSEGDNGTLHSKIYYYHTLAEAKEQIIVELYLLPDFPPVSGEGGSRIEDSAVQYFLLWHALSGRCRIITDKLT